MDISVTLKIDSTLFVSKLLLSLLFLIVSI